MPTKPISYALALGSNLGNRAESLAHARQHIASLGHITAISRIHETAPLGPSKYPFLNQCLILSSTLDPLSLLTALKTIEKKLGRKKRPMWHEREIDIDIILTRPAHILVSPSLRLPHPEAAHRDFVLRPLAEIAGDWTHPLYHESISTLHSFI